MYVLALHTQLTTVPKDRIIPLMGILTSQKINAYYDLFRSIDVVYSKEIIQVTGLVTNQVYLKCVGDFWPCAVYSSSFQGAKVVVNIKSGILQKLERANSMISLRFCFKNAETGNTVTFFINTKAAGYTPHGGSEDIVLFKLQFTQRPPDDFIEIMGRILDANVNSAKRREERIFITPESIRKLNITKESSIFIEKVPRHCIVRDISFSGVKLIMMGVAKFLVDKDAILRLEFDEPREFFMIKGKFLRSESVEGRKELVSLVLLFDETVVPMGYKIRINDYLSQVRAENRGADKGGGPPDAKPVTAKPFDPKAQVQKIVKAPPKPKEIDWPSPDEAAAPITAPSAPSPQPAPSKPDEDDSFDLQLP